MIHILNRIPSYIYLAGILGATATYVLYTPSPSSHASKTKSKRAVVNGNLPILSLLIYKTLNLKNIFPSKNIRI
jgi:hypothetical protein